MLRSGGGDKFKVMNKDPVDSLYIMCVIRPFSALFICTNTAFKKGGG